MLGEKLPVAVCLEAARCKDKKGKHYMTHVNYTCGKLHQSLPNKMLHTYLLGGMLFLCPRYQGGSSSVIGVLSTTISRNLA